MASVQLDLNINKHRSPSAYRPWRTLIRTNSLNYNRVATHETPRYTSGTQQLNTLMDTNNLTLPGTRVDVPDESSPLLLDKSGNRSYQAYCVTEASSRPSSPDTLIPRPLCIRPSSAQDHNVESQTLVGPFFAELPVTSIEQAPSLAVLLERDNESNAQQVLSNRTVSSRNTKFADEHHITQAVTPRGSHLLAAEQTLVCNRALSHSRMQQTSPAYVVTSRTYQRRPLQQNQLGKVMEPRPLPPLPIKVGTDPDLTVSNCQPQRARTADENPKQLIPQVQIPSWNSLEDRSAARPPTAGVCADNLRIRPYVNPHLERSLKSSRPRVLFQAEVFSPDLHAPRHDVAVCQFSGDPQEDRLVDEHAQIPSLPEMYVSRGFLSDMNDDKRAHRRTEPKDPKFKYQFGRRPSVRLDMPPTTPPHRLGPKSSRTFLSRNTTSEHCRDTYRTSSSPLTSFPPFNDSQPGPRPPPWGSYDKLEMQRRDRGDAREREEARKFRFHADSASSISKGSDSTDSLHGNTMRREVEEYRTQVLRVYPDMEFDGSAGKGGRSCYCCVVM